MSENLDEELELEWEDGAQLPPTIGQQVADLQHDQFPRQRYFAELFPREPVALPTRIRREEYLRRPVPAQMIVPAVI